MKGSYNTDPLPHPIPFQPRLEGKTDARNETRLAARYTCARWRAPYPARGTRPPSLGVAGGSGPGGGTHPGRAAAGPGRPGAAPSSSPRRAQAMRGTGLGRSGRRGRAHRPGGNRRGCGGGCGKPGGPRVGRVPLTPACPASELDCPALRPLCAWGGASGRRTY